MLRPILPFFALIACFAADNLPPEADRRLARDIYKEMVEIKSGYTTGATSGTYSTNPASGYTVTYQVLYYSAATNPPTFLTTNPDVGLQEIVLTVNGPNRSSEVLDFLKEQP